MSTSSGCDAGASIELSAVALRFRRYGDASPSLKQAVINALWRRRYAQTQEFWLYRGLDLRVRRGDRLGVVGHNGAGKSTLLKLICGIYRPTAGVIRVRGRVAPLIELGAGFKPELSAVDNILLNGAILGFGRRHMLGRVHAILDFAGLADHAGTPVKYFSTGMVLRLAFSIATDIDPEILLMDEIFAAGDAEFVQKASDRMRALIDQSHIVVLVSHALPLIEQVCNRAVWIDHGRVMLDGEPKAVCDAYLQSQLGPPEPAPPQPAAATA